MGFVTVIYRNASPLIHTAGRGFGSISTPIAFGTSTKYRLQDLNDRTWLLYIHPTRGTFYDATVHTLIDTNTLLLRRNFQGVLQLARNPLGIQGEALYDLASTTFATSVTLTASVHDTRGTYTFAYTLHGPGPLLHFLLPHHVASLEQDLKPALTKLQLRTTTKGLATAALLTAHHLTFVEPALPTTLTFAPWTPQSAAPRTRYAPDVLAFLSAVAERDLRRALSEPPPLDSTVSAGRFLARLATLLFIIKDILGNTMLIATGLDRLKAHLARFVDNRQRYALYYDDAWKGLVSSAGFAGTGTWGPVPTADSGNTYYAKHHVQYAPFVYTAAVIAYLDAGWLEQGDALAWTNMLVKDFAESDFDGRDYPFSRGFDWWHGHGWGRGLVEAPDGKDAVPGGEEGFAAFAVHMWGRVTGDAAMAKRGEWTGGGRG